MKKWRIPRKREIKKFTKKYKGNKYTVYRGSSKYVWILDPGHGGIIDGVYQTEGKRSPIWDDGTQLFEGESNRSFLDRIAYYLELNDISYINLVDTNIDTPLFTRTRLANLLYKSLKEKKTAKDMIYVSIHSDAFRTKTAKGWSVFTSPGETKSDIVAEVFAEKFKEIFPKERLRADNTDGDLDKEAKFWVLTRTAMPAILTENFFMTNPRECKEILMSEDGRQKITDLHVQAIKHIEANELI